MTMTQYPQSSDLQARLVWAGVIANPRTELEAMAEFAGACEAASDSWENLSGYEPFLVAATDPDTTWYFDGDGSPTVDLQGGFVHITSVAVNSIIRLENTDYRTWPQNAAVAGRPITYLKFQGGWFRPFPARWGQKGAVTVVGLRGYATSIKQVVYEAVLAIAIGSLLGESEFSKFRGIKSWKIGTDERAYDPQAFGRLSAACAAKVRAALNTCKRQRIA